jgi:hypothetical protein
MTVKLVLFCRIWRLDKVQAEHDPTSRVWALYSIMTLFMRMAIYEQEGLLALAAMIVHKHRPAPYQEASQNEQL